MSFIISAATTTAATIAAVGATAAAVGAIGSAVGTGVNMYQSTKDRKNAARAAAGIQGEIDFLVENRTEIINPFADVTNLSDMATDLSGNITDLSTMATDLSNLITDTSSMRSNPYADLSVATQAAEFEAEEADIALANTLDMLASTGSSAGGATALAQAALQSKRGISASIQQQEQANQTLAAKGEESLQQAKQQGLERVQNAQLGEGQRMQNLKIQGAERVEDAQMSEAQRLQAFQIAEAGRMQEVGVKAALFNYTEQDKRDLQDLDRATSLLYAEKGVEAQAKANYSNAITSGVGSLTNIASSYIQSKY
tara:strand:+ start:501 stop:1436 length:936 start_codon:yes stop_codon:yes gene_type:complete